MKLKFIFTLMIFCIVFSIFLVSCGECTHEFQEWETVKEPTCINEGTKIAVCSLCSLSKTESVDKTKHKAVTISKLEPTCQRTGLTEGSKCKICDEILTAQLEIPKIEHSPTVVKGTSPTCNREGTTDGIKCTVCNQTILQQDIIPKTEHNFIDNICEICGVDFFSNGLEFTLNDDNNSYRVSLGNCVDEKIVIPSAYNSLPVTHIDSTAFNNGNFKEIVIPDSILSIEAGTFKGCISLEKITIPFVGKSSTATGKESVFGYIFGDAEYDGSYSAKQAYSVLYVKTYYIPNSITTVNLTGKLTYGAFDNCKSISSITIPSSTTAIPNFCFRGCSSLKELPMSDNLISIGEEAFRLCKSATSVSIPKSVTTIKDYAFSECYSLSSFYVHSDNENYKAVSDCLYSKNGEKFIFYALGKEDKIFTLEDTVISIENYAFYCADNLNEVILSSNLVSIGNYAFKSTSIQKIAIPEGVISIGSSAFSFCKSLNEITFPRSLIEIGTYAFQECSSLKSIVIPENVKVIKGYAFSICSSLTSVYLPSNITEIGEGAFWRSYNAIIYCEEAEANEGWHKQWNTSNCTVVWNYTKE